VSDLTAVYNFFASVLQYFEPRSIYKPRTQAFAVYKQGDSGGICSTLGNDSVCDSKQKSSYENGSDFERLPRYDKKKIRAILRALTAIT
jgi:hypothetical protein